MTQTVLILGGSGKIGKHSSTAFEGAGWTVRQFDRKTGDMVKAAQGGDVIVNGLNPAKYHDWARTIPAITAQVIAAAKTSGATVIIPGNIYNFGNRGGEFNEMT
ncbi:MAG: epimerase, partial [Planktotalea sp.]